MIHGYSNLAEYANYLFVVITTHRNDREEFHDRIKALVF